MTQIIQKAIADANAVQAVAEERAKSMLIKEFSPRIKSALASLINEEVSTGSDQPGGYNPEEDQDAIGATVPAGQSSEDMSDKGDGPEKIKEEEDLPVDDKEEEPVVEGFDDDNEDEPAVDEEAPIAEPDGDEDEVLEIVDEPAPEVPGDDEGVPPSIEEEDVPPAEDEPEDNAPIMELKKRNFKLAKENKQLREAVQALHNKFRKIDLFNAKLAYAFKLMTRPGLSRNQKRQIAETFDAAKSVRETQLIYKTLKSGLTAPVVKKPLQNKNVRSVISESTKPGNDRFTRQQELAGL